MSYKCPSRLAAAAVNFYNSYTMLHSPTYSLGGRSLGLAAIAGERGQLAVAEVLVMHIVGDFLQILHVGSEEEKQHTYKGLIKINK